MAKQKFYAVKKGKNIGVYNTWDECKKQVNGFSGAEYKSFSTFQEAKEYIDGSEKLSFQEDKEFIEAYVWFGCCDFKK